MANRVETLLNAVINGETIDFNPQSRMEEYLKNCINKTGTEGLPAPQSRVDALLYKLAETIASGGGGGAPTTPTDNRTRLCYWYQYLVTENGWQIDWDDDAEDYVFFGDVLEEIEYPKGTQDVTNFSNLASVFIWDGTIYTTESRALPVKKFTGTLDASGAVNVSAMFANNPYLIDFGNIIFGPNIVNAMHFMLSCPHVTTAPVINTINLTIADYMFYGCESLTIVPEYDFRNVTSAPSIFHGCTSLTNVRLKNLNINTQIGSGNTYGHMIVVDDLVYMIQHLRNAGTSRTFTIGSTNLNKLSKVWVKLIDITDEMRAEDEFVDEKLPFERYPYNSEPTLDEIDDGWMTISSYARLKNWTLK